MGLPPGVFPYFWKHLKNWKTAGVFFFPPWLQDDSSSYHPGMVDPEVGIGLVDPTSLGVLRFCCKLDDCLKL